MANVWQSLGTPAGPLGADTINPPVAVATNQDTSLMEVFVIGSDGAVWHIRQESWQGPWGPWLSLGKPSTDPAQALVSQGPLAVGRNQDGRLEAFAADIYGGLWNIRESSAGSFVGSDWNLLGQVPNGVDSLAMGINSDGTLELFTVSSNTGVGHMWQSPNAGDGYPEGWVPLGGLPYPFSPATSLTSAVVILDSLNQLLEVFLTWYDPSFANGSEVLSNTKTGGKWAKWLSLGSPPPVPGTYSAPVVGFNQKGKLEVFIGGFDGKVYYRRQESPGNWDLDWSPLGAPTGDPQPYESLPSPSVPSWPAMAPGTSEGLAVFATGLDGALWTRLEEVGGWTSLGTPNGDGGISRRSVAGTQGLNVLAVFVVSGGQLWRGWGPIVSSCVLITAVLGKAITPVTMTASGGSGSGFTFSATGLPSGLSMAGNGTISGTPLVSGAFQYTVEIIDSVGNISTLTCSVTVDVLVPNLINENRREAEADVQAVGLLLNATGVGIVVLQRPQPDVPVKIGSTVQVVLSNK